MKNVAKMAVALFLFVSSISPVFAQGFSRVDQGTLLDFQPGPLLLYPMGGQVALTGRDSLEFKWQRDAADTSYFIFKLYKGYGMYESNLIAKERFTSNQLSHRVKSELFEDGQTYTWSLVRVLFTGNKTDKSFSSFKVVKK